MPQRIGIVGAGIIGLTLARELLRRVPDAALTVYEKEGAVGQHQTRWNSGVVHAGLYYTPGSLKARLCRRGMGLLQAYCQDHGIAYEECGKVVVATEASQIPALEAIHERARANGVPAVRLVGAEELRSIEPEVQGVLAVHSPHTAIVDFAAVAHRLATELEQHGVRLRLATPVTALAPSADSVAVHTTSGVDVFDRLVNCGGLHADRLAVLAGDEPGPRIVPFRGEFLRARPEQRDLVRGLVYPVPDPRYPFLGVHLTPRIDGELWIGPNALLALSREGYRYRDVRLRDVWDTLRWPGFRHMARQHWRTGLAELHRSLRRHLFVEEARRFVPALRSSDVERGPAGVRAQAVEVDGSLVDDFRITRRGSVVNVRNAPSPAATSSFAIAEQLAGHVLEGTG